MNKPYLSQTLLLQLKPFQHVKKMVINHWGTVLLQDYFSDLMTDTRDGDRTGFPAAITEVIFKLTLINTQYLESIGLSEPLSDVELIKSKWALPTNF